MIRVNSRNSGDPYIVVHQYDKRWIEFKNSVIILEKNLVLNNINILCARKELNPQPSDPKSDALQLSYERIDMFKLIDDKTTTFLLSIQIRLG